MQHHNQVYRGLGMGLSAAALTTRKLRLRVPREDYRCSSGPMPGPTGRRVLSIPVAEGGGKGKR